MIPVWTRLCQLPSVVHLLEYASLVCSGEEEEEEEVGRRQWVSGPPESLLDAMAQAKLTTSTVDSQSAGQNPA